MSVLASITAQFWSKPRLTTSSLDTHSASVNLNDGNLLVVLRAYFDGSGKGDIETPFLTLAGVAAADGFWSEFETAWRAMLADRTPQAPYLHMAEAMSLSGSFDRDKGWDSDKVEKLVNDAIKLTQSLNRNAYRAFTCTVDVPERQKWIDLGAKISKPEKICAEICGGSAAIWLVDNYVGILPVRTVDFFFDQNEKFKHYFEKVSHNGKKHRHPAWQVVNTIAPADMRHTPGIQFADMVAWSITRHKSAVERSYLYLWPVLQQLMPISVLDLNAENLRWKFSRLVPPL